MQDAEGYRVQRKKAQGLQPMLWMCHSMDQILHDLMFSRLL